MNLEEFDVKYKGVKNAEMVEITCDHPQHDGVSALVLSKVAVRRNLLKNDGKFVCRKCFMKHSNPGSQKEPPRQTSQIIMVFCTHPEHKGERGREMMMRCYFGPMVEPYEQVCKSCAQLHKVISEEQKQAISETLTGRKLSEEHRQRILDFRNNNPEWAAKVERNLFPHGGWNKGKETPPEVRAKISEGTKGKKKTEEHRQNMSEGRKRMFRETGGYSKETRERISRGVIESYKRGFNPNSHTIGGWHSSPKAGDVYYRSSYEKKAYMILDADPTVEKYAAEQVEVRYENPKKKINGTYLIDIDIMYTSGRRKLVEVKPEFMVSDEEVAAKLNAARDVCKQMDVGFEVWTEVELFGSNMKEWKVFADWLASTNREKTSNKEEEKNDG